MIGLGVVEAAIKRIEILYKNPLDRVVIAVSGGKDSTVLMELCYMVAERLGRLPIEVMTRDDEIMFPGTFEYLERVAKRPGIKMHWITQRQPVINIFNRESPYFWVFDPLMSPTNWVRQPPSFVEYRQENAAELIITDKYFPPQEGGTLYHVKGLRCSESRSRSFGLMGSGDFITRHKHQGALHARPIYDTKDGDIWKIIKDFKFDFNSAYSVMNRLGLPRHKNRIAPPTQVTAAVQGLQLAAKAWPRWFDKVCERCPGARLAANFGLRAVKPLRRQGETWAETYERVCVREAPTWISERSVVIRDKIMKLHRKHSTTDFPQRQRCHECMPCGSWYDMAALAYNGDPFAMKQKMVPLLHPEFFRKGAGRWDGKPGI